MSTGFWKLIDEAASRSDFRPTLAFWKSIWPSLVGDEIALHSTPCGWNGATLTVEVQQGGWEKAMERAMPAILRKLKGLPWPIDAIDLLPGHVTNQPVVRHTPRDLDQVDLPEDAEQVLADADLDRDIAHLAGRIRKHLEWEKKSS